MCTETQFNKIITEMVDCYKVVYGKDIVEIVLYGSYARGDFSEDSDIDLVAIVYGARLDLQNKLKDVRNVSAELGFDNDVLISPMVIPYDEFIRYKQTLPYYRNIAKEGKKIG